MEIERIVGINFEKELKYELHVNENRGFKTS
jgi:hypothetical protein